jgi:hypothetical protein
MSETPKDAKGIFLAAVDIQEPAERAAFLDRSCGGDPALRQRVEDLLRAYGQSDGPLDNPFVLQPLVHRFLSIVLASLSVPSV